MKMHSTKKTSASNANSNNVRRGQQKSSNFRFVPFLFFGCLFLCLISISTSSIPSSPSTTILDSEQKDQEQQEFLAQEAINEGENNKIEEEEEEGNIPSAAESVGNVDKCDVHHNQGLHALMDRICELCHDMYSHQRPNMRADCRSDCFRSSNFKRCLRLFKPVASPMARNRGMRHLGEAMDALSLF